MSNDDDEGANSEPVRTVVADVRCLQCKASQKDVLCEVRKNKQGRDHLHGKCPTCERNISRLPTRDPNAPKKTKVKKPKGPTVTVLQGRARELGIKSISKYKKAELIAKIAEVEAGGSTAVEKPAEEKPAEEKSDDEKDDEKKDENDDENDISKLKVPQLRALAKSKGIRRYTKMNKGELIAALSALN